MPKTRGAGRTRNYATIVYPESAPSDWFELLGEECVPAFVSPLHDKDVNPGGEFKKPHYHVMLMFEGVKTVEQANAIFEVIGGVGCEVVNSIRGYARYLCHLDNPEKVQYPVEDVRSCAGADYFNVCSLASDKQKAYREMCSFCRVNKIYSVNDLQDYAASQRPDWYHVLTENGCYYMTTYIKGMVFKRFELSHFLEAEGSSLAEYNLSIERLYQSDQEKADE